MPTAAATIRTGEVAVFGTSPLPARTDDVCAASPAGTRMPLVPAGPDPGQGAEVCALRPPAHPRGHHRDELVVRGSGCGNVVRGGDLAASARFDTIAPDPTIRRDGRTVRNDGRRDAALTEKVDALR